jgi:hypothetical protein
MRYAEASAKLADLLGFSPALGAQCMIDGCRLYLQWASLGTKKEQREAVGASGNGNSKRLLRRDERVEVELEPLEGSGCCLDLLNSRH